MGRQLKGILHWCVKAGSDIDFPNILVYFCYLRYSFNDTLAAGLMDAQV